jgi:hypothetical protein
VVGKTQAIATNETNTKSHDELFMNLSSFYYLKLMQNPLEHGTMPTPDYENTISRQMRVSINFRTWD